MSLILYHHNSSVCAAKVRVALSEKSLPWEGRMLKLNGDQFEPTYLELNPKAVVPTLLHNGRPVIESNVILEYLDDAFPRCPLRPDDPYMRAKARLFLQELDNGSSGIHHATSVLTYAIAYRYHLIAEASAGDRELLEAAIKRNMNRNSRQWLKAAIFDGIHAPAFLSSLKRVDRLLDGFEECLSKTTWLSGNAYSIADTAYTPYMVRFDLLKLNFLWRNKPLVSNWYRRLQVRESMNAVLDWYDHANVETLNRHGRKVSATVAAMLEDA